jgi:hypothetical protein
MRLLGRVLLIVFAFVIASVAAAIIFTIGLLTPNWHDFLALLRAGHLAWVVKLNAVFFSEIALIPMLLIIPIAERFGWRSVLFHAAAGLALALFFRYGLGNQPFAGLFDREWAIISGAGMAGGIVYWVLAGRNAGTWRAGAAAMKQ